jgi:hypothetical protein
MAARTIPAAADLNEADRKLLENIIEEEKHNEV